MVVCTGLRRGVNTVRSDLGLRVVHRMAKHRPRTRPPNTGASREVSETGFQNPVTPVRTAL